MNKNRAHDTSASDDGAYVVKKSKKLNIIAFVMCLLVSFSIWLYVMNTQTSDYTKTFTITVEAINVDKLEDDTGLSVFGLSETQASVTLSGRKSDVQKYSEKDFRAYIDVSKINQVGYVSLSVAVEVPSSDVKVMTVEPQKVTVYADYMKTKTISAACHVSDKDSTPYMLHLNFEQIEISGPATYIDQIDKAQVDVPSGNYELGDTVSVGVDNIKFFSSTEKLHSSLYITVETQGINVKVTGVNANE